MKQICSDLEAQYQELDDLVAGLDKYQWQLKTPFFNWSIFDEVAHIAFFDKTALLAVDELDQFRKHSKEMIKVIMNDGSFPAYTNPQLGLDNPEELLLKWRKIRTQLLQRLNTMGPKDRLPWYGPDMSARSFATARLMETWAHSQDIFDTLRIKRTNRDSLRHVAHIGVSTFGWSFILKGLKAPEIKPRIELTGPGGDVWNWGEAGGTEWVRGSAEDFCLVATQRRNVADTGLTWQGENVFKWLTIAQAFAGIPQDHPPKGVRHVEYKNDSGKTV
jgi:uncharacterized protein (TIGR03084 family)